MTSLFGLRSRPFYQFGQMMYLSKIPIEAWVNYIQSHFVERNRHISRELATELCLAVEQQSSYVQQLASLLIGILSPGEDATEQHLHVALDSLLDASTPLFKQQIAMLTGYQMNFLRAIISGHRSDFGEKEVREMYDLGSPSNLPRLKNALLERDLIELDGRNVFISDPLFKRWLEERGWADESDA